MDEQTYSQTIDVGFTSSLLTTQLSLGPEPDGDWFAHAIRCKLVEWNTFGSMLHKSNHFTYVIVVSVADKYTDIR